MKKFGKIVSVLFLTGVLLIAGLFASSSIIRADNGQSLFPLDELTRLYKQALISPLEKSSSELKDPQLAQFTRKLIGQYELEKPAANPSASESDVLANLLPDLKKINKTAMEMPLIEAGKQIKDKELSDFYNSFINRIGVGK